MSKIGTLTTGVGIVTTFSLNYVPQTIRIVAATALTGMIVSVEGDGTPLNLDAAGLAAMSNIRKIDSQTNEYNWTLTDGLLTGKNCTISITNSAAQTPDVFVQSEDKGAMYLQQAPVAALATTGLQIEKFGFCVFPSAAAADIFNFTWRSGVNQNMTREDIAARLGITQKMKNTGSDYAVDNLKMTVSSILFTPVAAQTVYVAKWIPSSGVRRPIQSMNYL
jgi:hypothetical protein